MLSPIIFRLVVVDDHPLVREGILQAIKTAENFELAGVGQTAFEAIELVRDVKPDILLLDLNLPGGGMETLRQVMTIHPATKVVILTVSDDVDDVLEVLALGGSGYILKGATGEELVAALRSVGLGSKYVSPNLGAQVLSGLANGRRPIEITTISELTDREQEIAQMIGLGKSNKLIAADLGLSEKTIKHNLTTIFRKVNVVNRVELAFWVRSKGTN